MRQAQWDLDSAAFRMPRGEVAQEACFRLADGLEELARQLPLHATRAQIVQGGRS